MNKKYIQGVVIFVLFTLILLGGAWLYVRNKQESNLRGKPVFAATKAKINYLGDIKIISPENGEINIYRLKDGGWRFKEANEYFVNEEMLASFFKMLKESIIMSEAVKPEGDFSEKNNLTADKGIVLQTYDYEGNLLDDVVVGKQTGKDQVWILKSGTTPYAYTASGINGISDLPENWLPHHMLDQIIFIGMKTQCKEMPIQAMHGVLMSSK